MKQVELKKREFEYGDKSMSIVFLNTLYYQDWDARNKIDRFVSNRLPLKNFRSRPWWKKQNLMLRRKMNLNSEMELNLKHFLETADYQDFDARIKMKKLWSKPPLQVQNFQFRSWLKKSSLWIRRFMCLNVEINQNWKQFLGFLDYQDSFADIKMHDTLIEFSPTSIKFWIEILIEELKPVVMKKMSSNFKINRHKSILTAFFGVFELLIIWRKDQYK